MSGDHGSTLAFLIDQSEKNALMMKAIDIKLDYIITQAADLNHRQTAPAESKLTKGGKPIQWTAEVDQARSMRLVSELESSRTPLYVSRKLMSILRQTQDSRV